MTVKKEQILELQNSTKLRKELNLVLRWRILTSKGGVARIVAYQDSRDVQEVLDHVVGPTNWSTEPRILDGKLYMSLGINIEDEGWVFKSDVGTETSIEATKGESSDAFKRASVMWGIFRDIYQLDYIILKTNGRNPVTPDGIELETPVAITLYCNSISEPMSHLRRLYLSMKHSLNGKDDILKSMEQIKNFINEQK